MKTFIASLVLVSSLASAANANSYSINTANNSGCTQNESTGRSMEFTSNFDTLTDSATVGVSYRIELGKKAAPKIDCNRLYNIEVASQQLQLDKARLELDLLRAQIARTKQDMINGVAPAIISPGDDW